MDDDGKLPRARSSSPNSARELHNSYARAKAIGLMIVAVTLFSFLDTTAKYLVDEVGLPVIEVSWVRFATQFLLILTLVPVFGHLSVRGLFTTKRLALQIARSVFMALTTLLNFLALKYLRLDQTITIMFLSPLVVALIAGPLFDDWVGWRRLAAILVGFAGVLIVVRPGFGEIHPAIGFSFGAMLAYVMFIVVTQPVAGHDPPIVTLFYSMFAGLVLAAPFAFVEWIWPADFTGVALMLALGIFGAAGHYLFILAHRLAPSSLLAPFIYLQIISMSALGFLVFDDIPDLWTIAGSVVIVASGIYLMHRERIARAGQG